MVKLWYESPGHRKIMLDPRAKTIGVGVAINSEGKLYAVQNYGR
ncbi:MAG: CAP domain-containing protein [Corynebacterium sp.]|nr:CAP domain-containing protein [Corynebacterium sp.]